MPEELKDGAEKRAPSGLSVRIFSAFGIPVRVHFTFLLFLTWLALSGKSSEASIYSALVVALFFCVLLHEFGHALVARAFGVKTRDITLYPMGGVAMLDSRPTAFQELWIALAGPAVNVVIAVLLFFYLLVAGILNMDQATNFDSFAMTLMIANLGLAAFNLIPAFPMDGGRVLRSLLGLALPDRQATKIAAGVGQVLALLLGSVGLAMGNFILVIIAFVVFIGASHEVTASVTRTLIAGHLVKEVMVTDFVSLQPNDLLSKASELSSSSNQPDFPVLFGDEVLGLLRKIDMQTGLYNNGPASYVAGSMKREFTQVSPEAKLEDALAKMNDQKGETLLVTENSVLVGLLTNHSVSQFINTLDIPQRQNGAL